MHGRFGRRRERTLNEIYAEVMHRKADDGLSFSDLCALLGETVANAYKICQGANRVPAESVIEISRIRGDYSLIAYMVERIGGTFSPPSHGVASTRDLAECMRQSTVSMSVAANAIADRTITAEEFQALEEAVIGQEQAWRSLLEQFRHQSSVSDGRASTLAEAELPGVIRGRF